MGAAKRTLDGLEVDSQRGTDGNMTMTLYSASMDERTCAILLAPADPTLARENADLNGRVDVIGSYWMEDTLLRPFGFTPPSPTAWDGPLAVGVGSCFYIERTKRVRFSREECMCA